MTEEGKHRAQGASKGGAGDDLRAHAREGREETAGAALALGCAQECSLVEGELLNEAGNRTAWVAGKESGSLVPVPWWPVGPPVGNVFDCVGGAGGL